MSLGISYSHQEGGEQQFSTVSVNGNLMTSAAGGEDDGLPENGALLTVGGDGDSIADPADPMAPPTNARSDDELYDLKPFVQDGATEIHVATDNSSNDDNVFLATFISNPPVTDISTNGKDTDGDGLPDVWETDGVHGPDGTFINLPAMGANPKHKDIFLRVDAEAGAALSSGAKKILVNAFKKAPVHNPDGHDGINLHLIDGPTISAAASDALSVGTVKNGHRVVSGVNFLKEFNDWDAADPTDVEVFHYAVSVHWDWPVKGGTIIGESANIPAQELVVNQCGGASGQAEGLPE